MMMSRKNMSEDQAVMEYRLVFEYDSVVDSVESLSQLIRELLSQNEEVSYQFQVVVTAQKLNNKEEKSQEIRLRSACWISANKFVRNQWNEQDEIMGEQLDKLEGSGWRVLPNAKIQYIVIRSSRILNHEKLTNQRFAKEYRTKHAPLEGQKSKEISRKRGIDRENENENSLKRSIFDILYPLTFDENRHATCRLNEWKSFNCKSSSQIEEELYEKHYKICLCRRENGELIRTLGDRRSPIKTVVVLFNEQSKQFEVMKKKQRGQHLHEYCNMCSRVHKAPECKRKLIEHTEPSKRPNFKSQFGKFIFTADFETTTCEQTNKQKAYCISLCIFNIETKQKHLRIFARYENMTAAIFRFVENEFLKQRIEVCRCANDGCILTECRLFEDVSTGEKMMICAECFYSYPHKIQLFFHNFAKFDSQFLLQESETWNSTILHEYFTKQSYGTPHTLVVRGIERFFLWRIENKDSLNYSNCSLKQWCEDLKVRNKLELIDDEVLLNKQRWGEKIPREEWERCIEAVTEEENNEDDFFLLDPQQLEEFSQIQAKMVPTLRNNEDSYVFHQIILYCLIDAAVLANCLSKLRNYVRKSTIIDNSFLDLNAEQLERLNGFRQEYQPLQQKDRLDGLNILLVHGIPSIADQQWRRLNHILTGEGIYSPPKEVPESIYGYEFIHKQLRGGVSTPFKRYANHTNGFIFALDVNALYSWCMLDKLPNKFERVVDGYLAEEPDTFNFYICNVTHPESHKSHSVYSKMPLAPHHFSTSTMGTLKLGWTFRPKENYMLTSETLAFYRKHGLLVDVLQTVVHTSTNCLAHYINYYTSLRKKYIDAKRPYLASVCKLMLNSVYGKTCENVFKYKALELVQEEALVISGGNRNFRKHKVVRQFRVQKIHQCRQVRLWPRNYGKSPYLERKGNRNNYHLQTKRNCATTMTTISYKQEDETLLVDNSDVHTHLNKIPHIGFAILERAKLRIQEIFVALLELRFNLIYTDTDSIFFQVPHNNPFAGPTWLQTLINFKSAPTLKDLLDVPISDKGELLPATKAPGLFSLEVQKPIREIIALAPKSYSYETTELTQKQKHKGLNLKNQSDIIDHQYYYDEYFGKQHREKLLVKNHFMRNKLFQVEVGEVLKLGPHLQCPDDTKFIYSGEPGEHESYTARV